MISERLSIQLSRILKLTRYLMGCRHPHSTADICRELNQATNEEWHPRTILRDLLVLHSAGLVDFDEVKRRGPYMERLWKLKESKTSDRLAAMLQS